jgi:membrane associated rhomboid family serine protease
MKTIKTYLVNLPKGVKIILSINLLVYTISLISSICFNFDVNHYLGFYPTHSGQFEFSQLLTFMFTHSYNPTHIIVNLICFLLFSVSFAKKFGSKNYILMYVFSSIVCVFCFNILQNYQNKIYKKELLEMNIQPKKLNISDLSHIDNKLLYQYNETFFSAIGSSGAVCGFIISFIIFNVRNIKKLNILILYVTSFFVIYYISIPFIENDFNDFITQIGHVGGILGGMVFSIFIKIKKGVF